RDDALDAQIGHALRFVQVVYGPGGNFQSTGMGTAYQVFGNQSVAWHEPFAAQRKSPMNGPVVPCFTDITPLKVGSQVANHAQKTCVAGGDNDSRSQRHLVNQVK